jgi:hypothetical protein
MNQEDKTPEQIEAEKFLIELEKSFLSLSKGEKDQLFDDIANMWKDACDASFKKRK